MPTDDTLNKLTGLAIQHGVLIFDPNMSATVKPQITDLIADGLAKSLPSQMTDLYGLVEFYRPIFDVDFRTITADQEKMLIARIKKDFGTKFLGDRRHILIAVARQADKGIDELDDFRCVTLGAY